VIVRTLEQVAAMAGGEAAGAGAESVTVTGVCTDSRSVRPGSLFVPIVGPRFDGHRFVEESIAGGAAAALWQADRGRPPAGLPIIVVDDTLRALQRLAAAYRSSLGAKIIGVTGSNGKTTTKDMVHAVLSMTMRAEKTQGNLNNHIGLPLTLLSVTENADAAVLEMGMSARGEISELSRIAAPDIVIVTNVGEAHLETLGSRLEIARAKLEILDGVKEGAVLVYNGDEPLLDQVLEEKRQADKLPPRLSIIRFGEGERNAAGRPNDVYPVSVRMDGLATRFVLNASGREYVLPLPGRHHALNAAAAVAAARALGVKEEAVSAGLASLKPSGMRVEPVHIPGVGLVLNDAYNASPTSVKAALRLLEDMPGRGRKIAVLGDMLELGAEEARLHGEIGKMLTPRTADYVLTYGPLAKHIAEAAAPNYERGCVRWYADKAELARDLSRMAGPDDVILVKASRGMSMEDVVNGLKDKDAAGE